MQLGIEMAVVGLLLAGLLQPTVYIPCFGRAPVRNTHDIPSLHRADLPIPRLDPGTCMDNQILPAFLLVFLSEGVMTCMHSMEYATFLVLGMKL